MDENISDKAKRMAEGAADALKDKFKDFEGAPSVDEVKALARELAEDASAFVKKYPLQSVAGAAAVGFLLGAFLNRKR